MFTDNETIEIVRKYSLVEHILNTNHTIEFDEIKVTAKISKPYNRV